MEVQNNFPNYLLASEGRGGVVIVITLVQYTLHNFEDVDLFSIFHTISSLLSVRFCWFIVLLLHLEYTSLMHISIYVWQNPYKEI